MKEKRDKFYVYIKRENNRMVSHAISFDEELSSPERYEAAEKDADTIEETHRIIVTDFPSVLEEFKQNMSIYLDFIPITLTMMPMLSISVSTERLDAFVSSKGKSRDDLSSNNISAFEFEISAFPAYLACEREIASTARG